MAGASHAMCGSGTKTTRSLACVPIRRDGPGQKGKEGRESWATQGGPIQVRFRFFWFSPFSFLLCFSPFLLFCFQNGLNSNTFYFELSKMRWSSTSFQKYILYLYQNKTYFIPKINLLKILNCKIEN